MTLYADQTVRLDVNARPPPASWYIQHRSANAVWMSVSNVSSYSLVVTDTPAEVDFARVNTTALRVR